MNPGVRKFNYSTLLWTWTCLSWGKPKVPLVQGFGNFPFLLSKKVHHRSTTLPLTSFFAIPAAIYRSAQGPGPESAPRSAVWVIGAPGSECPTKCFLSAFWNSRFLGPKVPKNTRKALFGALRARCPKSLKKHSVGHFQARGPGHSCKWRLGSQLFLTKKTVPLTLTKKTFQAILAYEKGPNLCRSGMHWFGHSEQFRDPFLIPMNSFSEGSGVEYGFRHWHRHQSGGCGDSTLLQDDWFGHSGQLGGFGHLPLLRNKLSLALETTCFWSCQCSVYLKISISHGGWVLQLLHSKTKLGTPSRGRAPKATGNDWIPST